MNILFVYYNCIAPTRGGTERVTYSVAKTLQKRGHHIYFLSTRETGLEQKVSEKQLFMPAFKDKSEQILYIQSLCNNYNIDAIINEQGDFDDSGLFSKLNFESICVISCLHFDIYGAIKFFNEKIKSPSKWKQIIWDCLHAMGINAARRTFKLKKQVRLRKMVEYSHAIVVPTATLVQQFKKFTGMNTDTVVHIDNPYPFDINYRGSLNNKENTIIYVGRLSKEKQVHILIEAWAKLQHEYPDWNLSILGDGPLRNDLESIAKKMSCKRIQFHGNVGNVEYFYRSAKVLALTSAHECTGGVILESLAHYVHPVTFYYPSVHEFIVTPEIGTIVRQKSVKALITSLRNAMNNWNIDKQYAIDNHIQRYSIEKITDLWERLITKHIRHNHNSC